MRPPIRERESPVQKSFHATLAWMQGQNWNITNKNKIHDARQIDAYRLPSPVVSDP